MSVNKVFLVGRLGRDPEEFTTTTGKVVSTFSLATDRKYTNEKGEKVEETEWHSCAAYGKVAEVINKYLKKGRQVYLEGFLRTREFTGKDGVKRWKTEVIVNTMQMIGSASQSEGSAAYQSGATPYQATKQSASTSSDEVPF